MHEQTEEDGHPAAWRINIWRRQLANMSRSKFYEERESGRIQTVKMGSATLVVTSPRQYIENLKAQAT